MPLFFFIAGMTLRRYDDYTQFTVNKINRIFIPYLFFSILWTLFDFFILLPVGSDGPLWFLPTMFASLLFCQTLFRLKNQYITNAVIVVCVLITYIINHLNVALFPFDLDRMLRAVPYIYAGFVFCQSHFKEVILNVNKYKSAGWLIVLTCLYFACLYLMLSKGMILEGEGFMRGEPYGKSLIIVYVASFSAILATIVFSYMVRHLRLVNWLGKNSLVVLCIHYPFTQYWNTIISSTGLYESGGGRIVCAIISYIIIIGFCIPGIYLCKHYIPKLTGYDAILK